MSDLLVNDPRLSITEKLEEKRKDVGITQGDIGRALRPPMKQGTVSTYERDPSKLIPRGVEFAISFFLAYGFNDREAHELTRQVFPGLEDLMRPSDSPEFVTVTEGSYINVYAAGTGPAWGDTEVLERVFIPSLTEGKHIGLKATGDSMTPYLNRGDVAIVLCDDGAVSPGNMCAVWLADDGCVIKRLVTEHPDGRLLLESLNPAAPAERFFTAPLGSRVIGKVVKRLVDE